MAFKKLASLPLLLSLAVLLLGSAQALHFYLHNTEEKCFLEDLPKHTTTKGHFKTKEWIDKDKRAIENPALGLQVKVRELPSNNVVMSQKAASEGRFTFTSAIQGQHYICLQGNSSNWFNPNTIYVEFDMTFGSSADSSKSLDKLDKLSARVRELNQRSQALQLEIDQQRERESEFRDVSEKVNSHVVWYVLMQIAVLALTCVWQVRYLKGFFEKKKLM
ncbi:emp24p/erv25p- protein [Tieghemiomyces parasiticus]|uniref:Emp24p/erv25p- protein n=1 Tax=Tieghemiomyces parasiticus TaxID=78921 RepID=A0A9W8DN22_9FUNG|nr:emp24p/erv25p- protein [Tieghemiomyces parasiticus]KAJ1927954.1 emp24p/erv25p- protein [Tieghemiomyces parasiticus]